MSKTKVSSVLDFCYLNYLWSYLGISCPSSSHPARRVRYVRKKKRNWYRFHVTGKENQAIAVRLAHLLCPQKNEMKKRMVKEEKMMKMAWRRDEVTSRSRDNHTRQGNRHVS